MRDALNSPGNTVVLQITRPARFLGVRRVDALAPRIPRQCFEARGSRPAEPTRGAPSIDRALAKYGLKSHEVGGQGDCQFRALAQHLLGDAELHPEVRARVAAELRANRGRYIDFAEEWGLPGDASRHGQSYDNFVARMACLGEWGGNATLQAAANVYRRTFNVVNEASTNEIVPREESGGDDVWLAYVDGNHYRATLPLDQPPGLVMRGAAAARVGRPAPATPPRQRLPPARSPPPLRKRPKKKK